MKKIIAFIFLSVPLYAGSLVVNQGGTGTAVIMQGGGSSGGGTPGGTVSPQQKIG